MPFGVNSDFSEIQVIVPGYSLCSLFSEIGKDTHPATELQFRKLFGSRISAEIQQIGVGDLIQRLAGSRDFARFGIFHEDSAGLRVDNTAFLQLIVQLHDLVDDTFRFSIRPACRFMQGRILHIFSGTTGISQTLYKILALIMLFIGGLAAYSFVWDLGDFGVGLMTIFNMIALFPLAPQAMKALRDYEQQRASEKVKRKGVEN